MKIYNRAKGYYIDEKEYGEKGLRFLYNTIPGRILLKLFFCRKVYSKIHAIAMKSKHSIKKIQPFIDKYNIDLSKCENTEFISFDNFFTRKCVYSTECTEKELISPCDGRLSVYIIDDKLTLKIKNSVYTLSELTDNCIDITDYCGGICFVYRLAVEDYHRYVFCDRGKVLNTVEIKGTLHTIRPISERYRVFCRNHRVCTLLQTQHFDEVIQIEVGALQVGKINNHSVLDFSRLDEKGYFSYGGSTIIQLFKAGSITVDEDISEQSVEGIEVLVKIGERVGKKN